MKTCSLCGKEKELSEFGNYTLGRKGPKAYCRECETNYARRRRAEIRRQRELAEAAGVEPPKSKKCARCGERKSTDKFPVDRSTKSGFHVYCQACLTQYHREYVEANPQVTDKKKARRYMSEYRRRHKETLRQRLERVKDAVFEAYGGYRCACCGVVGKLFCTLAHIDPQAKKLGVNGKCEKAGGKNFYQSLLARNFPPGFKVLCWNCNCGEHLNGGICPHKTIAA